MVQGARQRLVDNRPVEIVIKATDNASRGLALITGECTKLTKSTELMKGAFVAAGAALVAFTSNSVGNINSLIGLFERLRGAITSTIGSQIIAMLKQTGDKAIAETQNYTTTLSALFNGILGPELGARTGSALGRSLGQTLYENTIGAINLIDKQILDLVKAARDTPKKITSGLDILGALPTALAGFGEPLTLFKGLQNGVRQFAGGLIGITQEIGQFSLGIQALQQVAQFGPFQALIQQNIELRAQLLSTQTSLAATNDVLIGGVVVEGASAAIQALEGPVLNSISKMRRDSLELVGVTSKELVSVYSIISGQISSVGGGLNDASDLTIDFAAALGTLQVPLDQARQEVNSILQGQISADSYLAKSIGLTNQQLQIWRQQGTVVQNLRDRLSAFTEGNKIAARSVGGIASNIQEIFDEILRVAGEPLLDPVIDKLEGVYNYLKQNSGAAQDFIGQIVDVLIEVGEIASRIVTRIFEPAADISGNLILLLFTALVKAARATEEAFNQLYPVIEPFINVLRLLAANAETVTLPFFKLFLKFQGLKLAVGGLSTSLGFLGNLFPFFGEVMAVVDGRANSLLNQFVNLSGSLGRFGAAGLLAAKNLNSIPGAMAEVSKQLGIAGPFLAPMIPLLGSAGITLTGLATKYPAVRKALNDGIQQFPVLAKSVALFAEKSELAGGILKNFAPQLHEVSKLAGEYGDSTKLLNLANEKIASIGKEVQKSIVGQVGSMALYGGAIFALFFALDNLILKNEGVMAALGGIGNVLLNVGEKLMNFLRTPAVSATIAIAALVVLIQTGLIPSLLATAAATAKAISGQFVAQYQALQNALLVLNQSAFKLASSIPLVSAATRTLNARMFELKFNVAAMGLPAYIKSLLVVAASKFSLSAATTALNARLFTLKFNIAAMGLPAYLKSLVGATAASISAGAGSTAFAAGLRTAAAAAKSLVVTLGPIALAVVGIAAVTEVIRILHDEFFAGNKILKEYLKNLRDAEVELENAKTRTTGGGDEEDQKFTNLQKVYEDIESEKNFVQKGFDRLRGGGTNPVADALKALADEEAGLIELSDRDRRFYELTVNASKELRDRQEDFSDLLATSGSRYNNQVKDIADLGAEMSGLIEQFNNGEITEEQYQQQVGQVNKEIEARKNLITQEIDALSKKRGTTEGERQLLAQTISDYERLNTTLEGLSDVEIEQKGLPRLGTQYEQLAQKAQQAETAINEAKGDPAIFANNAKELISSTEQLLQANLITEEEAIRRLSLVATSTEADAATIGQAQQSITKTIEGQSQERLALIKSEQAETQQAIRSGVLTQVDGQKQLLELVKQEGEEKLAALESQYQRTKELRAREQQDSLSEQLKLLDELKAQLAEAGGPETRTGEGIAGDIAVLEGQIATTRQSFAAQAEQSEKEYQGTRVQLQSETAEQILTSEETLHETRVRQLESAQSRAIDVARKAQLETDIQNQNLLNSGSITQEALSARRLESNRKVIQEELNQETAKVTALEALPKLSDPAKERERQGQIRQARLRTQELTLQLLESERQSVEANIALLEKDLKDAAKAFSNELETQIQSLERQKVVSDQLTKSYELRRQIAEAENSLAQATAGYISTEFELLAETTQSEYRKQQIAQVTATIKLQTARLQAEFAQKSLEIEYEQNKLARERELTENRIAILRAEQAVRQGAAEVDVAQERFAKGIITRAELDEVLIKQQGNVDRLGLERQTGDLIRQQQGADERVFQLRAQQGALEARTAERQAQVGLAQALPPGLRERALNQIGEDIAQSFGYASRADLINSGTALARGTAQQEFGVGQGSGGLSAFDSTLEGLREVLSPSQYAAAVADSQKQFDRQLGPQPFSLQQDQLLGRGATPLQLPGIVQPAAIRLGAGDVAGRDIGFPSIPTAAIAGRDSDRLIAAFQQGSGEIPTTFNIEVIAGPGQEGTAVAQVVQQELEKVIERSRQLIRR